MIECTGTATVRELSVGTVDGFVRIVCGRAFGVVSHHKRFEIKPKRGAQLAPLKNASFGCSVALLSGYLYACDGLDWNRSGAKRLRNLSREPDGEQAILNRRG